MKKNLLIIVGIILIGTAVFFTIRYFMGGDPLDVDVSDIELSMEVERFDLELRQKDKTYADVEAYYEKYGSFFDVYNFEIIGIGGIENSSYLVYLNTFLNDYAVIEASAEVDQVYSDCNNLNAEITDGFKHLLYYYPDAEVPRIVSFVAGFNQSVVLTEGFIGVGLDKYLGADCQLYEMLSISEYARAEMVPEQIPIDIMKALAQDKYQFGIAEENLLNYMIYNGKILYFLDAMFPDFEEARKNKYSKEQLSFC